MTGGSGFRSTFRASPACGPPRPWKADGAAPLLPVENLLAPVRDLLGKACSSRAIREHLHKCGIRAVIPVLADRHGHRLRRGSQGGRPPAFDREAYKWRNTVEQRINRLKQGRGITTRYEETATIHPAGLRIAGIFLRSAR
ncbi:hypothetical protein ACFU6R_19430 [Streptomyces sp. NPDC057499]|uniref:hypothetical protein n=1 Tax=Streptomyces sp. NPDC057499 TaxID=3346150 RepID=UPI0036A34BC4